MSTIAIDQLKFAYIDTTGKIVREATASSQGFAEQKTAFQYKDKVGFMDCNGKEVIPPMFKSAKPFQNERAEVVTMKNEQAWISFDGRILARFLSADYVGNRLQPFNNNQRWGYDHSPSDNSGRSAIQEQFDYALPFSEGLAAVRVGTLWGYIDTQGHIKIKPQWTAPGPFVNGHAVAWNGNKKLTIDKNGEVIKTIPNELTFYRSLGIHPVEHTWVPAFPLGEYSDNVDFSDGRSARYHDSGKYGAIDDHGQWVVKPLYDYVHRFQEGRTKVQLHGQWHYIDRDGKQVGSLHFQEARDYSRDGLAAAMTKDGKWGFVGREGQWAIKPQFAGASDFSGGIAAVSVKPGHINALTGTTWPEDAWGFIDTQGNWVLKPQFSQAHFFSEGFCAIQRGGQWGYINREGKIVVEPKYFSAQPMSCGRALVSWFK